MRYTSLCVHISIPVCIWMYFLTVCKQLAYAKFKGHEIEHPLSSARDLKDKQPVGTHGIRFVWIGVCLISFYWSCSSLGDRRRVARGKCIQRASPGVRYYMRFTAFENCVIISSSCLACTCTTSTCISVHMNTSGDITYTALFMSAQ